MAKLVLSMDGLVLKEIALSKERTTIGRRPSNDIQIDNMAISGEHAVVVSILSDSFLEDLNSTNGTFVNGQPIKKHCLKNGDLIELGKYRLKYLIEQPGASDEIEKTVALTPSSWRTAALAADARAGVVAKGVLQILNGANAGRELELTKNVTTLGKPGVQAAVIARRPQGYFLTHVEGAEFPQLNGRSIEAQTQRLNDHDVIEIAGIKMGFFVRE